MIHIEGILFDFGGVMARFFRPALFRREEARLGLAAGSLAGILWDSPDWRLAEVGAITDQDYWRRTSARLGLSTPDALRRFQGTLFDDVQADARMVGLVRRLRERYRVGLLSNAGDSLPGLLREKYGLDGLFDVVIVSALVGVAKPDPAIFRLALDRLGSPAERTLFVDDHEPNVAAAAALGLHAIHFVGYDELLPALERAGVRLP